ncbi:1-deoxy-D-xylulose-5-phosphate reductoisomerase [Halorhodospira abdelmalekii]|uniref:1-deoxy-D-xylulose-5-phosphate reductoisomerase n=1 Tax=Halorhodospira abdelmalekii TaxID=421629 RepID=UPI0019043578|nr:1-deoxy-D-xylulose-5-phosphate reductoisomerase [Halorhodospira abdelmalekii]MBK1735087.1 1-deoxy-D-xylulose-5-phosphate reductoisomerase [Halorhodospira abdelmalekii]
MRLAILGATGSIGRSTLDVAARHPQRLCVEAVAAGRDVDGLFEICQSHRPRYAALADPQAAAELERRLQEVGLQGIEVAAGETGVAELAALESVDAVVTAVVGAAGLASSLAACSAGKRILLANKETLVVAGELFMATAQRSGAQIVPVDSEHNAVFQALPADKRLTGNGIERIVLTASGGPFRDRDPATLAAVTPEEACAHPNWSMGRKISVDSATMMNKGLEVIEACHLFDLPSERIDVVIHRQSLIHALVGYHDGSYIAQIGAPDMRVPISYALGFPERIASGVALTDLVAAGKLEIEPVDERRFPCLGLAYQALRSGGGACAVLNGANEVAVDAFLGGRLRYDRIAAVIEEALASEGAVGVPTDLESACTIDARARRAAERAVARWIE